MMKYSVMIVDDNETDRYLLRRFLAKTELVGEIFEAYDGENAVEFLRAQEANKEKYPNGFPPTLLFLDINMPRMNGFEFLEEYQRLRKEEDLSIVVMMFSSSGNVDEIDKAFSYDCVKDYIEKGSFDTDMLKEKILRHVDKEG